MVIAPNGQKRGEGGGGEVTEGGGVKGAVTFSCTATDSSDLPAAKRLSLSMKPFSRGLQIPLV